MSKPRANMTNKKQQEEARVREFSDAARLLSDEQQRIAMESQLDFISEVEAGIIRQKLAEPDKPFSPKQQAVFDKHILPAMVEKCGGGCGGFSVSGVEFCDTCAIRFG